MKIYDDITPALSAILRHWSTRAATCWIGFCTDRSKLPGIQAKWIEDYGTTLDASARRYRKSKSLPRAWACALPVLGMPHLVECVLLASEEALTIGVGPFSRQAWRAVPPEASDFVMIREPRERRDYAWTWRLQDVRLGVLNAHLVALVRERDGTALTRFSHQLVRIYPMFGGVRRQLRRMLRGSAKLWVQTAKSPWPGPDPEHLPAMVGFRPERVARKNVDSAKGRVELTAPDH